VNQSNSTRPGFGEALLLLVIMLGVTAVSLMLLMPGSRESAEDISLLAIAEILSVVVVLLIGIRRVGCPAGEIFRLSMPSLSLMVPAIPMAVATVVVAQAIDTSIQQIFPVPDDVAVGMIKLLYADRPWQWVRVISVAVISIPIAEELLFRGLFLRGFTLRYGRFSAIFLSSLLFVIVHFNPWAFTSIFISGWLLAWVMYKTHSIWPAIIFHGLYNCCGVVCTWFAVRSIGGRIDLQLLEEHGPFFWDNPIVISAAVVVLGLSLFSYHKIGYKESPW